MRILITLTTLVLAAWLPHSAAAQEARQPNWTQFDVETLRHYQALLQLDTSSPPGRETQAVEYLSSVLKKEGIAVEIYAFEPDRANLVARIKGNGRKRPLLIMGHTDVVTVDPKKWSHPPFGAVRDGGYIYGRGTIDDKDNRVASLMVMLTLKRQNVPLDRDVIFVAESGEEGGSNVGASFLTSAHLPAIDAEYCFAEGGNVRIEGGHTRPALGLRSGDRQIAWSRDSQAVYVQHGIQMPVSVERVVLATGARSVVRQLTPSGVSAIASLHVEDWVDDGRWYAYRFTSLPSTLFVVNGAMR